MNDLAPIERLEAAMLALPQADCPVIHRFGPGLYIREVHIPADTFAIGHYQRCEHMNVFLKGRVTIVGENGLSSELVAPMMFVGKPGRKVGYTHEDVVWLNIYATHETDIERLEETFLQKSISWQEHRRIGHAQRLLCHLKDIDDYATVLVEFCISAETALAQSENESDQIALPLGSYKCKVGDSLIHGKGLFATAPIEAGEVIAPARIDGKRTLAGRYTNHSASPNARMLCATHGRIDLVATRMLRGCSGGLDGEEITINYRQALSLQMEEP